MKSPEDTLVCKGAEDHTAKETTVNKCGKYNIISLHGENQLT